MLLVSSALPGELINRLRRSVKRSLHSVPRVPAKWVLRCSKTNVPEALMEGMVYRGDRNSETVETRCAVDRLICALSASVRSCGLGSASASSLLNVKVILQLV